MIDAVKFVSIPVRDQDRAVRFYTEQLGFRVTTDAPYDERQRWIELTIPGGETKVVLFTPEGHEERVGGIANLAFTSAAVEVTYRELLERGVEFVQPLQTTDWGSGAVFKDSEGNLFALSSR